MKILIIEDDLNKLKKIKIAISEFSQEIKIDTAVSYQSGLKAIINNTYNLILLDMSLPSHDSIVSEHEPIGGINILIELKRRKISVNIIVVTQFTDFSVGNDIRTLEMLKNEMSGEFKNYIDTILYVNNHTGWKTELINYIKNYIK